MGSFVSKQMDDSMKKNQQFMMKNQEVMLERQLQMQNQMRERMAAMQIARARDLTQWLGAFYGTYALVAIMGVRKNRAVVVPLVPFTFLLAYQADMAYGSKMQRMRGEANRIMDAESELLALPHGLPSLGTIEAGRIKQREEDRFTKSNDIFF